MQDDNGGIGVVVSFYSYKGGVGRSFAVANIATILAQWGFHVLCVDFDIEAPGLSHYFAPWLRSRSSGGLLQYLHDCTRDQVGDLSAYILDTQLPGVAGRLTMIPSGRGDDDYIGNVQKIDWHALSRDHDLGVRLERARAEAVSQFDFVLIDGRTGITDFAGIVTAQLPDILAFLFTANKQSLDGVVDVTNRAMLARNRLPFDRGALLPLPIPARFEQREEYKRAEEWKGHFLEAVAPFYDLWVSREVDFRSILELTTIPYVPYWSFGEEIAVLQEPTRSPHVISYHLETLAALLAHRLHRTDLLASSREEYVTPLGDWRSAATFRMWMFS